MSVNALFQIIIIVSIICGYINNISAQDEAYVKSLDSLESILKNSDDRERRHHAMADIIELTKFKDRALSQEYVERLLADADSGPTNKFIVYAKIQLAKELQLTNEIDSSIALLHEVLVDSKKLSLQGQIWRSYMYLGNAYDIIAIPDSTFHYFQLGYNLKETIKDTAERNRVITTFATNLANVYYNQGDLEEALNYYSEAAEVSAKTGNKNYQGVIYNNIGNVYADKGDDEKAIEYYDKSIKLRQEVGNDVGVLYVLPNILDSYMELKDYDAFFEKGYWGKELADKSEIPMFQVFINSALAFGEAENGRPAKGVALIKEISNLIEDENLDVTAKIKYYESGYKAYFTSGNYFKAKEFLLKKEQIGRETGWQIFELFDIYNKIELYNTLGVKDSVTAALSQLEEATTRRIDAQVDELGIIEAKYTNLENQQKVELLEEETKTLSAISMRNKIAALSAGAIALITFFFLYRMNKQRKIIEKQNASLEALNNTKDQIFSIIGHDIKKPVLAFRGLHDKLSYLIENKQYDNLLRLSKSIDQEAVQLNKLTDNLLSWALLQKEVLVVNEEHISLQSVVEEVMSLFKSFADNKSIALKNDIPDITIKADRYALSTIIRNLIDNAIKYSDEGDTVELIANQNNDQVKLKIKDTGMGIPKEKLPGIFLLSKNKSTDGANDEKGTGLGLHIVKELVVKCKGKIQVESELNKGTVFTLSLPVA